MLRVLNRAFDKEMKTEEEASTLFAGGVMQHGYQCGMLWGAALAAGAQAYRCFGVGAQAEIKAIMASRRLVEVFHRFHGEMNCLEITDIDKSSSVMKMIGIFLLKGKAFGCLHMCGQYAKLASREINTVLSQEISAAPSLPVSCAALLAQKLGASEFHTLMASGLAGGIGLCGGACGALGTAIWFKLMSDNKKTGKSTDFKDPRVLAIIEKFLKCTDYTFECHELVGRKFTDFNDHAAYLRNGGCAHIIAALAAL